MYFASIIDESRSPVFESKKSRNHISSNPSPQTKPCSIIFREANSGTFMFNAFQACSKITQPVKYLQFDGLKVYSGFCNMIPGISLTMLKMHELSNKRLPESVWREINEQLSDDFLRGEHSKTQCRAYLGTPLRFATETQHSVTSKDPNIRYLYGTLKFHTNANVKLKDCNFEWE